ncbi:MAG: hypothetical protein SWK76_15915 [Actinomycetota bacterium]|nr:hypothetical protein [Actinomycetota bacterium]
MRILLISANRSSLIMPAYPLGLAWVSSALKKAGHSIRVLDLMFSENRRLDLGRSCGLFAPMW